jgi:hypothetical protein
LAHMTPSSEQSQLTLSSFFFKKKSITWLTLLCTPSLRTWLFGCVRGWLWLVIRVRAGCGHLCAAMFNLCGLQVNGNRTKVRTKPSSRRRPVRGRRNGPVVVFVTRNRAYKSRKIHCQFVILIYTLLFGSISTKN